MINVSPRTGWVLLYALLAVVVAGLGGCASASRGRSEPPVTVSDALSSHDAQVAVSAEVLSSHDAPDAPRALSDGPSSSWVKEGKTFVLFPFPDAAEATPFLNKDVLTLDFTPHVPALSAPIKSIGVLKRAVPVYDQSSGEMTRLELSLVQPVRFLLSRPVPDMLQVLLAPRSVSAQTSEQTLKKKSISGINFSRNKSGNLFITLDIASDITFEPREEPSGKMSFLFGGADVPARFARLYRLEKFSTVIGSALLRNVQDGVLLTLLSSERVPVQMDRRGGKLVLQFMTREIDRSALKTGEESDGSLPEDQNHAEKTSALGDENLLEMNTLFPGMKKEYSGSKISIDFQDADVELILRLIAEVSGHNLIIDEKVTGKISLKLKEIPWDQVLELVLQQERLGVVMQGSIMRVTTAKQLESERDQLRRAREAAQKTRESMADLEPLQTRYLQINYSTAAEIEPKVREFLSSRGKISQDARTNMLIIRDAGSQLEKIGKVIAKLDRPERQVLIEARIVYATDSFQRSLGISWSGSYDHSTTSRYSRSFNIDGISLPSDVGGIDAGVNFAKIAGLDLFSLDAQLRLGELKDIAKTISSPRVVTLNNNRAEIQQGTKVASQTESESGGTTTEYTDAILSLSVQPQITPDNKLILDLDISDDSPSGDDISTRTTKTKMIVSNNETIVIGGVQKSTETETEDRVPGLASIPGLGWLFKNQSTLKQKEELLIFIRPRILD